MSTPQTVTAFDALHTPFRIRTLRSGYEPDQVDDFLDLVAAALTDVQAGQTPTMTIHDVFAVKFDTTRFQPGYHMDQVDDFLDLVADTFEAATAGTPCPS